MEWIAGIAFLVGLAAALGIALRHEDVRLRRRARRYRELEHEGIEQLRRRDPYPEDSVGVSKYLRAPDGTAVDADRVLYEELERARAHTRRMRDRRSRNTTVRNGKGAACLL
jgi:hypothetical protein